MLLQPSKRQKASGWAVASSLQPSDIRKGAAGLHPLLCRLQTTCSELKGRKQDFQESTGQVGLTAGSYRIPTQEEEMGQAS